MCVCVISLHFFKIFFLVLLFLFRLACYSSASFPFSTSFLFFNCVKLEIYGVVLAKPSGKSGKQSCGWVGAWVGVEWGGWGGGE